MSYLLAIHGGAGTVRKEALTPEDEAGYRAGLRRSLEAGHRVLAAGGNALDAVTAAVMALEDEPLFQRGKGGGSHDGWAGRRWTPRSWSGADRAAGAVAGVCGPRNPVLAARAVMERSRHVLLIGEGARAVLPGGRRRLRARHVFPHRPAHPGTRRRAWSGAGEAPHTRDDAAWHGTVGAVARDARGNLAAATSTGGMTAKLPGRVGDSPVFGAGRGRITRPAPFPRRATASSSFAAAAAHEIASRHAVSRRAARIGGRNGGCRPRPPRRFRRSDRGGPYGRGRAAVQQRRDVPRNDRSGRCTHDRDPPRTSRRKRLTGAAQIRGKDACPAMAP